MSGNYSKLSAEVNRSTQGNPSVQALMVAVGHRLDEIEHENNEKIIVAMQCIDSLQDAVIALGKRTQGMQNYG